MTKTFTGTPASLDVGADVVFFGNVAARGGAVSVWALPFD